jgi:hypothetical protein
MTKLQFAVRAALVTAGFAVTVIALRTPGVASTVLAADAALYVVPQAQPAPQAEVATFRLPTITIVARRLTAEEIAAARAADRVVADAE